MIEDELKLRALPDLLTMEDGTKVTEITQWEKRRVEIREILDNFYAGIVPPLRAKTKGKVLVTDEEAFAGKAVYHHLDIELDTVGGSFQFCAHMALPKHVSKPPVFLYISFEPELVTEFSPVEEIIDAGYGFVSFYYQDVAPDTDSRFLNGVAKLYNRNPFDSWGTISMWAWAASRVMDYLQTLDFIDTERIAVVGHSRLGKTALWAGACDQRFSMVISNDSGGGGAALFRGKVGEKLQNFNHGASKYWFCGNFLDFAENEEHMPFDQHFLLSLVAPRNLYVCSAALDEWADPVSEFLGAAAASEAYEVFGMKGLVTPDQFPKAPTSLHEGQIGYHIRKGTHYLSRYDWNQFIEYRNLHRC